MLHWSFHYKILHFKRTMQNKDRIKAFNFLNHIQRYLSVLFHVQRVTSSDNGSVLKRQMHYISLITAKRVKVLGVGRYKEFIFIKESWCVARGPFNREVHDFDVLNNSIMWVRDRTGGPTMIISAAINLRTMLLRNLITQTIVICI